MNLLLALALAASAAPLELDLARFGAFKLVPFQLAPRLPAVAAVTVFDLERLFQEGKAPSAQDLTGWFAGRRFTAKGPAAQLLVGHVLLKDPAQGPLEGVVLKVTAFGGDEPGRGPVTYYDDMGHNAVDAVLWNLHERGPKADWKPVELKDTGAVAQDGALILQVRKNGELLVARYHNGDYAYFFKRVR